VPLTNRVLPTGEIVALPDRGAFMGNRGILHDADKRIVRPFRLKAWIICRTAFNGRRRELMAPNRYTELFFLDEATALAAGHRPCGECRHAAFKDFAAAWGRAHGPARAAAIDAALHTDRWEGGAQRRHRAAAATLPEGAMITLEGSAWLVTAGALRRWTPAGYANRADLPGGEVEVLTPRATLAVLAAGYRAEMGGDAHGLA
jgi:hypothetical protein